MTELLTRGRYTLESVCSTLARTCALPLFFKTDKTEFYSFTVKDRIRQFTSKRSAVCPEIGGRADGEKHRWGWGGWRQEVRQRVGGGFRKDPSDAELDVELKKRFGENQIEARGMRKGHWWRE